MTSDHGSAAQFREQDITSTALIAKTLPLEIIGQQKSDVCMMSVRENQ
jgi:hypothetical protein